MLASLNFVEKFISLPKVTEEIQINGKKISVNKFNLEKIAPLLTRQGFEVDSIQIKGEGLETVVVGRIEKIEQHPNASKLQICYVNIGVSVLQQIVCGAPNARVGLYVAVALPSTKLPNGLEIKPTKIRDIESNGMLCSRGELNLPIIKEIDGDGIWELDVEAQGGTSAKILANHFGEPVFNVLGISDVLLELSVTPNRPDMLCHEGVARELEAGFKYTGISFDKKENCGFSHKVKLKETTIKEDTIKNSSIKCAGISFSAENYLNAPAFFVLIDSVLVAPSPAWLRNLLENLGQNSINNIVDASNYVLLAHGQPSHAFDLEKLSSQDPKTKKLILRHAKQGEKFVGLDGKERELSEVDEVVSDIEGAQGLLGVIGGEHSKVSAQTQKIVVEFANPSSVSVRRASRRHGRQTDSSFIFEKGIDASARYKAALEFFALISDETENKPHYCGTVHSANSDKKPIIQTKFETIELNFNEAAQEKVLGSFIINYDKQVDILKSLGFSTSKQTIDSVKVTVPSWRAHDISAEADLVEEFIRVVGIDSVPSSPFVSQGIVNHDDPHYAFLEKICAKTSALGYNEVISLHFMRADDHNKLNLDSINSLGEPIAIINPIIGDEPFMHTTLIPDLLRKVTKNLSYGIKSGQIFHSCRTFQNSDNTGKRLFKNNGENLNLHKELSEKFENTLEYHFSQGYSYSKEDTQAGRPVETPRLAGVLFGNKTEKTWQNTSETRWSLHDIMSHVNELCRGVGVEVETVRISVTEIATQELKFHPMAKGLHPGRCVGFYILNEYGKPVSLGWAGELHPNTMRNFDIDVPCLAFEINTAVLMRSTLKPKSVAQRTATSQKLPVITRDFAFLLDESVTAKKLNDTVAHSLKNIIAKETPARLLDVNIFDVYRGKGTPENKKSVAFHISLEPLERTFNEKDIQKISETVISSVKKDLQGELRG